MQQHTPKHSAVPLGHVPAKAEDDSMLRSSARHVLLLRFTNRATDAMIAGPARLPCRDRKKKAITSNTVLTTS
jgi:hypothetical protein